MNPAFVAQAEREIADLLNTYPELAEDETLRADMVEGSTDAPRLLSRIVRRIIDAETMVAAIKERKADLDARQTRFDKQADLMRGFAYRIMKAANLRNLPLDERTLVISTTPRKAIVVDEGKLPPKYKLQETIMKIDKRTLLDDLKAGDKIEGAELSNGGETLIVRK